MNMTKTQAREYPPGTMQANSNAAFPLGLAMALLEDGCFGTHCPERAGYLVGRLRRGRRAGPRTSARPCARATSTACAVRRGWLGQPITGFVVFATTRCTAAATGLISAIAVNQSLNSWARTMSRSSACHVRRARRQSRTAGVGDEPGPRRMAAYVRSRNISVTRDTGCSAAPSRLSLQNIKNR